MSSPLSGLAPTFLVHVNPGVPCGLVDRIRKGSCEGHPCAVLIPCRPGSPPLAAAGSQQGLAGEFPNLQSIPGCSPCSVKCVSMCEPVNGDLLHPSLQTVVEESSRQRQARASHGVVPSQFAFGAEEHR